MHLLPPAFILIMCVSPEEDSSKIPDVSSVESSAELLYGLVHQRFILTKAGLTSMVRSLRLLPLSSSMRLMLELRSTSTSKAFSAPVPESSVMPPTSFHVDG